MLVYVPQGYVALVYENGALRTVVETGVGFVEGKVQVRTSTCSRRPRTAKKPKSPTSSRPCSKA